MPLDNPDWISQQHVAKPVPDITQNMFWWSEDISLSPGTVNTGTLYTVPAGKKLILLAFNISENKSAINLVTMSVSNAVFAASWFDTAHNEVFGGEGTISFAAGSAIVRKIWNYSDVTTSFRFDVFGIEVDA